MPTKISPGFLSTVLLLLGGCSLPIEPAKPDTTRYYVLGGSPAEHGATSGTVIGLKRVEAAAYLRGRQLAVRAGDNELKFLDDARWAEPLEAAAARVLRERLALRVTVLPYPFPAEVKRSYDLSFHFLQCEGATAAGGQVLVTAAVEITGVGPDTPPTAHHVISAQPVPWDGKDYAKLARLLGEAIGEIADRAITLLPADKH